VITNVPLACAGTGWEPARTVQGGNLRANEVLITLEPAEDPLQRKRKTKGPMGVRFLRGALGAKLHARTPTRLGKVDRQGGVRILEKQPLAKRRQIALEVVPVQRELVLFMRTWVSAFAARFREAKRGNPCIYRRWLLSSWR
jgi:hypothetical protein